MMYHLAPLGTAPRKKGFSLIEAAIVLGVVGIVVAGIWAAASTISEKREINDIKDFVLYLEGVSLRYRQGYSLPTTYLQIRKMIPDDTDLPGGFRIFLYPTTGALRPLRGNTYVTANLHVNWTQDGYNVNNSFNWWIYFAEDPRIDFSSFTYIPRPGICAGLLSWVIAQAVTRPILLGYSVDPSDPDSNKLYWDARTGAAPPPLAICKTIVMLDVFIW